MLFTLKYPLVSVICLHSFSNVSPLSITLHPRLKIIGQGVLSPLFVLALMALVLSFLLRMWLD